MSASDIICAECGYICRAGYAEFHPFPFCLLVKAGFDPWALVADAQAALERGDGPEPRP